MAGGRRLTIRISIRATLLREQSGGLSDYRPERRSPDASSRLRILMNHPG